MILRAPVRGAGNGPLAGFTAVVKDMYDIAGSRTGGGNPEWLAAQQPAARHAVAIEQILAAGATITGKTICDEFFYSVAGANAHYGTPANLRAPGRCPAAPRAARRRHAVPMPAISRSAAIPADRCVSRPHSTGFMACARPTAASTSRERWPWRHFDVAGWFANAPGVFRRVGAVLLRGDGHCGAVGASGHCDRRLRTGRCRSCRARPRIPRARCQRAAAPESERAVAPNGFDGWREAFRIVQAKEVWESFGGFVTRAKPKLGPGIKERMAFAATVTAEQADAARKIVFAARHAYPALVVPRGTILALPPRPRSRLRSVSGDEEMESFRVRVMRLTCMAGLAGLPQMNLPAGTVAGCPAGLSLIAWARRRRGAARSRRRARPHVRHRAAVILCSA